MAMAMVAAREGMQVRGGRTRWWRGEGMCRTGEVDRRGRQGGARRSGVKIQTSLLLLCSLLNWIEHFQFYECCLYYLFSIFRFHRFVCYNNNSLMSVCYVFNCSY